MIRDAAPSSGEGAPQIGVGKSQELIYNNKANLDFDNIRLFFYGSGLSGSSRPFTGHFRAGKDRHWWHITAN